MEMKKKGQTALEFLMTYGWAILIVAIVGAVLWRMGVFNPGRFMGSQQSGFNKLVIDDWALGSDGNLTVAVGYRKSGTSMTVKGAYVTDSDCTEFTGGSETGLTVPVPAGETNTTTFNLVSGDKLSAGDRCRVDVAIKYNDSSSGIVHNSTGTFRGKLG